MTAGWHIWYETLLGNLRSHELKRIAVRWGASQQARKEESLAAVMDGLRDPEQVRAVVARLPDLERMALGVMRMAGGRVESRGLTAGVRASGVELPAGRTSYDRTDSMLIRRLIESGTVLSTYGSDPTYVSDYGSTYLVADERMMAAARVPPYVTHAIAPAPAAATTLARRPAVVAMDVAALLRAVESVGGLQLTQAGEVRVGSLRKLAKAMRLPEGELVTDGLALPRATHALTSALFASGALVRQGDLFVVRGGADAYAARPYAEQVAPLVRGMLLATSWLEPSSSASYHVYEARYPAMRLALLVTLAALPQTPGALFAVDDIADGLFSRVGEHLSLGYGPHPLHVYGKSPAETQKAEAAWREKLRAEWQKLERPWIAAALSSWLYYLGVVELGVAKGVPVSARLTELGRAVLGGEPQAEAAPEDASGAWVVQPDFEVALYLDHATPAQAAFLERHADRTEAQSHVARYRLTRDSLHRGLERGGTVDELVARLEAGAGAGLPQNVRATLREWAAQRDRIAVRRRVSLLEFPNAESRDAAVQAGVAGQAIGERFVLLQGETLALPHIELSYDAPLPRCLTVTEDGLVSRVKPVHDMLLRPSLERYATPDGEGAWRLSAASVAAAARAGAGVEKLIVLLRERLTHPLPPLLEVALRAWAGKAPVAELAEVLALRCRQPEVFAALAGSPMLAPMLRGAIAPDVLLADPARLPELRERLAWAGLVLSETLEVV